MSYIHLKQNSYSRGNYSVTSLRKEDLLLIKQWRNEQIDVLRQNKVLTDEDQMNYYEKYILPSYSNPTTSIILFSFLNNNECIGYGGLTNIHWEDRRVELSFLVNPSRANNQEIYLTDFTHFIELMKTIVFDDLKLNRIFTETYNIRDFHISILEKCGFKLEGIMKEHVRINNQFVDSLIHGILKKEYEIKG